MEEYKAKKEWRGGPTEFEGFIFKWWSGICAERIYINDADRNSHGYIDISGWLKREIISDEPEAIKAAKDFLKIYHVKYISVDNDEEAKKIWEMYKDNAFFEEMYDRFYHSMKRKVEEYGEDAAIENFGGIRRNLYRTLSNIANYTEG